MSLIPSRGIRAVWKNPSHAIVGVLGKTQVCRYEQADWASSKKSSTYWERIMRRSSGTVLVTTLERKINKNQKILALPSGVDNHLRKELVGRGLLNSLNPHTN